MSLANDLLAKPAVLTPVSKYTVLNGVGYLAAGVLLLVWPGITQALFRDPLDSRAADVRLRITQSALQSESGLWIVSPGGEQVAQTNARGIGHSRVETRRQRLGVQQPACRVDRGCKNKWIAALQMGVHADCRFCLPARDTGCGVAPQYRKLVQRIGRVGRPARS